MAQSLRIETARVFEPLLHPARYKGAWGGRGSGKSHFFAELGVERCFADPATRMVCVREVQRSLKESVKRLVEDKIDAFGLAGSHTASAGRKFRILTDRVVTPGDGIILFQGMQDHTAESIKSLEGFDVAYVEEAQTLSARSLEYLRPTIRKPGSELWFSWNPRAASDPVDAFLRGPHPPNEAVVVKTSWRDNPWLPDVLEKERLHDKEFNAERYDHIWEGEYAPFLVGAYYGAQITALWQEGRVQDLPHMVGTPVDTAWDIGHHDSTAIWFFQDCYPWVHFIDYYEAEGYGADHYAKVLREKGAERNFVYGTHFLPHDVAVQEWGTDRSRIESLMNLGIRPKRVTRGYIDDGINASRQLLARSRFDRTRCAETRWLDGSAHPHSGLDCLTEYHRAFDDNAKVFLDKPVERHWSRHGADAFRTFAMGYRDQRPDEIKRPLEALPTLNDVLERHDRIVAGRRTRI